jgi:hypothetical protein
LAEGTIETEGPDIQELVGARFRDESRTRTAFKGNVQAAQLSLGEGSYVKQGTFREVGGSKFGYGDGWEGVKGSANVSLTLQPVYVS